MVTFFLCISVCQLLLVHNGHIWYFSLILWLFILGNICVILENVQRFTQMSYGLGYMSSFSAFAHCLNKSCFITVMSLWCSRFCYVVTDSALTHVLLGAFWQCSINLGVFHINIGLNKYTPSVWSLYKYQNHPPKWGTTWLGRCRFQITFV